MNLCALDVYHNYRVRISTCVYIPEKGRRLMIKNDAKCTNTFSSVCIRKSGGGGGGGGGGGRCIYIYIYIYSIIVPSSYTY